ncbi:flagellar hook assembly protein FlgD [Phenylobacterium aquaticum]|uniref:flagellar hook assembly protein FlgD n=1 Tax=Phenylobacterium aquaticum TaxID=1763816 RepID=UPI001F5C4B1B|nr:flagellar hook assembly protein FlgD [Phenylobacterium aquaticum]MCI3135262.1 flagellar hook assembly protein FlgD [Phenylobacterium aquaticum]
MAVDSTTGVTTTAATDSGALGKARLATNFNTFLTLLTTQLKNQDPLSPLDSNQFTQQLTQMTGVEQQIYSNDLLKQLVTNTGSGISTAVALIGKEVNASSADQGLVKGKATWNYNLPRAASSVQLEILDASGKVVQVAAPTDMSAGDHSYSWNGKDLSGKQLGDGGPYTMKVTAKDSAGADVSPTVFVKGVVTGVEQTNGKTLITLGGAQIPWETVTAITQVDTTSTSTSSATTNDNTTTTNTADAAA